MSSSLTTRRTIALDGSLTNIILLEGMPANRRTVTVSSARAGDHGAISRFLQNIFRKPTPTDYATQLEDPQYEPRDRIVARIGNQIIGHARVQMRDIHFGNIQLPIGYLCEMATAPEYRNHGIGTAILEQAHDLMLEQGAALGLLKTPAVRFYQNHNWFVGGRQSYSEASARNVLSLLRKRDPEAEQQTNNPLSAPEQPLNIRIWRHVEQEALMRLYQEKTTNTYGPVVRSDPTWRWLLNRHNFEQVYVAINGPKKLTIQGGYDSIVGYAIVKNGHILEMMTDNSRNDIVPGLLERVCGDVIEQKDFPVRLHAPHQDLLHELILAAGGHYYQRTVVGGIVILAKVFKPMALVKKMRHQINARAVQAGIPLPAELGLCIDGKKYSLAITPRSVKLTRRKVSRNYITLSKSLFSQLLLGVIGAQEAAAKNQLQASTKLAGKLAATLFPQLPVWLPPLDDLLA